MGSLQSTFQFSCNQTTPYGIYFLTIDKTADQSHFTELPIIPINVTFIPVPFNFETTSFSIPVGSSNFMLYIQGPLQIPNEYISLTFSLTNDSIINSGLTLIQNTIQFDKFNQYGFIYLSSQYEESFIGVSVSLQVNLSGPNANSYTLETTSLILNITDKSSYDLTANITGETNPAKVLTTNFTMSCSVAGVGYYQLTRADCSFMGIPSVISKVKNYFSFSSNDQCQNQFGIVNFESNGLSKIVNVTNIRANKNYIIYGFCQDYNDNYSSISNTNFTGKDNGGLLLKIKFFFKTAVTYLNKERLACFLNSFLGISSQK